MTPIEAQVKPPGQAAPLTTQYLRHFFVPELKHPKVGAHCSSFVHTAPWVPEPEPPHRV